MPESFDVFISYKREDQAFAEILRERLIAWGYTVWMDLYNIPAGADWPLEIERGIMASSVLIGVMTPLSVRSRNVQNEWEYGIVHGKRLIPIRLQACELPLNVIRISYVDFSQDRETGFTVLHTALQQPVVTSTAFSDPYRNYLQVLYDRINVYLAQTIINVRPNDPHTPEPIQLRSERTRGAVDALFEKCDEIDPLFRMDGIKQKPVALDGDFRRAFDYFAGRVLLLGEPGAGKTITLLHFGRDAVVQRIQDSTKPLPILAIIPTWDAEKQMPLATWLANSYGAPPHVVQTVTEGRALLLLDGLDELGSKRENPKTKKQYDPRREFMEIIPPNNQIIVTCRVKDYKEIGEKISLNGAVTLQELTDTQICNYLSADLPSLWVALEQDDTLRDMAHNPYMLWALINVYEPAAALPRNTGALLQQLVRVLWMREETRGTTSNISFEEIETAFAQLAFAMLDENMPTDVSYSWALKQLIGSKKWWQRRNDGHAKSLLQAGENANYIMIMDRQVRFYHQLMLEHFSAVHLCRIGVKAKLNPPSCIDIRTEPLTQGSVVWGGIRLSKRWDRVIVALIGLAPNPDEIIREIMKEDVFLAASCILYGGQASLETHQRVLKLLLSELDHLCCVTASELIGRIWLPEIISDLTAMLNHKDENTRRHTILTIARIGRPAARAIPQLLELFKKDIYVTSEAAFALGKVAQSAELSELVDFMLSRSEFSDEAIYAAEALATAGDARGLDYLAKKLFTAQTIGMSAAKALSRIATEDAVDALSQALTRRGTYLSSYVEALEQIGTIPALRVLSDFYDTLCLEMKDDNEKIRLRGVSAAYEIGESLRSTPVVPCLIDRLRDQDIFVKSLATWAFKNIKDTLAITALAECLNNTEFYHYPFGKKSDIRISSVAAEALEYIGTPEALTVVEAWRQRQEIE